jgi:homoaconitase/3-isopropylmalate dehydratase large subunit
MEKALGNRLSHLWIDDQNTVDTEKANFENWRGKSKGEVTLKERAVAQVAAISAQTSTINLIRKNAPGLRR